MKYFLVSFDLNKRGQDYDAVESAIKCISPSARLVLTTTWIIQHCDPAASICEELKRATDDNDEILVVQMGDDLAASLRSLPDQEWIDGLPSVAR